MATTAKVFMSGRSQAVRLPKEFRFDADEVLIERRPEGILLRTKSRLELLEEYLSRPPVVGDDFLADRYAVLKEDTRVNLFDDDVDAAKPMRAARAKQTATTLKTPSKRAKK
jgi:antitoxin VapB